MKKGQLARVYWVKKNYLLTTSLHDEPFKQRVVFELDSSQAQCFYFYGASKGTRVFRATVSGLWRGWRGILCAAEYIKNDPFKSDTWWLSDVRVSASEAALLTAVAPRMNQKWAVNACNKSTWLSNLLFKYNQQHFIAAKVKPTCG